MQVDGGLLEYQDQAIYKVAEILAERYVSGLIEYYVSWKDYDHTFNTWESAANIEDASLTDEWDSGKRVVADVKQAIYDLAESRAKDLMKLKGPEFGKKTIVLNGGVPSVAHALLERLRRPPSRRGKKALKLEVVCSSTTRTTSLQLNELDDIAWALQLEIVRPENAFGSTIFRRGRGSCHDMLIDGPRVHGADCAARRPTRRLRAGLPRADRPGERLGCARSSGEAEAHPRRRQRLHEGAHRRAREEHPEGPPPLGPQGAPLQGVGGGAAHEAGADARRGNAPRRHEARARQGARAPHLRRSRASGHGQSRLRRLSLTHGAAHGTLRCAPLACPLVVP